MKKRWYTVYGGKEGKCPVCGSDLFYCHLGEFCSVKKCSYVDGIAKLTDKQWKKFSLKLKKQLALK